VLKIASSSSEKNISAEEFDRCAVGDLLFFFSFFIFLLLFPKELDPHYKN